MQLSQIKSRRNIEKIIEDLDLLDYYTRLSGAKNRTTINSLIGSISNMIAVSTVKDTNIVRISVDNENPNLARNIANTLSVVYNDMLKELAQESFTVRREFIESQIGATEQQVLDAENLLREFKEDKGIYILDEEARLLLENVTYYEKQIDPYNILVSEAESKIQPGYGPEVVYNKTIGTKYIINLHAGGIITEGSFFPDVSFGVFLPLNR